MSSQEKTPSLPLLCADAVLEGGAMLGIAHVGALSVAEERGYHWQHCAGTSAGAIVAALLAAGYTATELYEMLSTVGFASFAQDQGIRGFWPVQLARLVLRGGLHTGNTLETFLRQKLADKGKHTFGDLVMPGQENAPKDSHFRYGLVVITSDITNKRMLRLPQDLVHYELDPDKLDIALAVRMSASIPFFFQPVIQRYGTGQFYRAVDGGLLSNFPVGIFDVAGTPEYPTFGFQLVDTPPKLTNSAPARSEESLFHFSLDLLNTMLSAHDRLYMDDHAYVRTVAIQVHGINGIQFHMDQKQIELLYQRGQEAANKFFDTWDFEAYKAAYRGETSGLGRQERLHMEMRDQTSAPEPATVTGQNSPDNKGNLI